MPIRMVQDENQSNDDNGGRERNPGGGGGGINLGCLMMLLPYLLKRPKLFIPLLILGGIGYFFFGNQFSQLADNTQQQQQSTFAMGGEMKEEIFDKAEVYEPLADNRKNPLPERVTLEPYCPDRLNQGSQGSCVAWSSAYAARTILESKATGTNPNKNAFSPSYLYNQIALEGCQGSYIQYAMDKMQKEGLAKFEDFEYDESDCSRQPPGDLKMSAAQYKTRGFNRLTRGGDDYKIDLLAIKQNLAQGAPVVIGMMVGGSFMQEMLGTEVWIPNDRDYDMPNFGGHAMCIIGYDDFKNGGAFQIMNSWGKDWGVNGIGWVRYKDFEYFGKEAYGLYPMGNAITQNENKLDVSFGLVENASGKNISLVRKSDGIYGTKSPIAKGTKFKVEVTNSADCYTYIFGMETDNTNYVLFPYTKKHSPYCGITGTRLFPKDYSMQADALGEKDKIAVLITKKPLDYVAFNESMNNKNIDFAQRFNQLIQSKAATSVDFKQTENISFTADLNGKNAIGVIIEIDKK
ncbi:MAG: peptidase C1A papain [Chitinophagales bacterium]|nr:peptidase C1A papain [Chitinophagales bacterium]